ncbi:hypothetical protein ACFSTI_29410 [Rhizorhabdus histidinilytica]|nr:hypothetical protein [Rhizorhabdus histidinilytica]
MGVQNVMCAYANLIGATIEALQKAEVPDAYTHYFLDRLELANEATLVGAEAEFAAHLIELFRRVVSEAD